MNTSKFADMSRTPDEEYHIWMEKEKTPHPGGTPIWRDPSFEPSKQAFIAGHCVGSNSMAQCYQKKVVTLQSELKGKK